MIYTLYYRNFLKYCNYTCKYCPFKKFKVSETKIEKEIKYLDMFYKYLKSQKDEFKIFIAPKGESLIFHHFKKFCIDLNKLDNIKEVVIQTNLTTDLKFLDSIDNKKLKLWITYHPTQVNLEKFINKIKILVSKNIDFSIGCVGVKENFNEIKELKLQLDNINLYLGKKIYLWINAYKDEKSYYSKDDIKFLNKIDMYFDINLNNYSNKNKPCATNYNAFMIDANGDIRRCYKDNKKLGNLYVNDLKNLSEIKNCNKNICTCFIGYNNIQNLNLDKVYKKSVLARIP